MLPPIQEPQCHAPWGVSPPVGLSETMPRCHQPSSAGLSLVGTFCCWIHTICLIMGPPQYQICSRYAANLVGSVNKQKQLLLGVFEKPYMHSLSSGLAQHRVLRCKRQPLLLFYLFRPKQAARFARPPGSATVLALHYLLAARCYRLLLISTSRQ